MLMDVLGGGGGIKDAVSALVGKLDGAYSVVGIWDGEAFAFRDPHAFRPLVYGENEDYLVFCSESSSLDANGIAYGGSVKGGELVVVGVGGGMKKEQVAQENTSNCMFEYVYFSRPDSTINGKLVEQVRRELGAQLVREAPVDADVVVPVPDTSRSAALGYSEESGIRYSEGIIKNRYIGRTFIMPTQEARIKAVRMKVNPMRNVFAGKRVVLIDDSIVRGTTMREMLKMIRACNPREIHLRIPCPPIKSPCFYGVDIPTYTELIANQKSVEEIRGYMGVDSLHYLSLEGLGKVIGVENCFGCLSGEYPTAAAREQAEKTRKSGKRS
jgi:amidophosphoribosyltransferase